MRKYLSIELYNGECAELTYDEFVEQTEGCDEINENAQFISYKFEEYVVIEDKMAEYDE